MAAHLGISPSEFWRMTPCEFWSVYDAKVPQEAINSVNGLPKDFVPLSDEQRARLEEIDKNGS